MTEEDVYEMGIKPKNKNAKVTMTVDQFNDLMRRVEALEKQEHQCDCPNRIVDMNKELVRLDFLDENDELLRQGINQSHADLEKKLDEEHRLRVVSEERIEAMNQEMECLKVDNADILYALEESRKENTTFSKQNLWLGVLAGACVGITLVVLAFFMAG